MVDRRLWIIFALLILSGLLYISTNFKELGEMFANTSAGVGAETSEIFSQGVVQSGGGIPETLLAQMNNISNILNN